MSLLGYVYALYEALLLAALCVDRGSGGVLSLLAAHGERSTGECDTEGGHCELNTVLVSPCQGSWSMSSF